MLKGRVEVNSRAREVAAMGKAFAAMYVSDLGQDIAEFARRNVAPGKGPGPHPHRIPHIDTGALMRSVTFTFKHAGFMETAEVSTDLDHGIYLEYGYRANWGGAFVRYPWLTPAFLEVLDSSRTYLRATARVWFTGAVQERIQRVGLFQVMSRKVRHSFNPGVFGVMEW